MNETKNDVLLGLQRSWHPKKKKKGLRHPQRRASSSSKLFDWPNAIGATFSMKGKGGGFGLTKIRDKAKRGEFSHLFLELRREKLN